MGETGLEWRQLSSRTWTIKYCPMLQSNVGPEMPQLWVRRGCFLNKYPFQYSWDGLWCLMTRGHSLWWFPKGTPKPWRMSPLSPVLWGKASCLQTWPWMLKSFLLTWEWDPRKILWGDPPKWTLDHLNRSLSLRGGKKSASGTKACVERFHLDLS